MSDSQDRREPFEPKLGQSYTYDDPITGTRDKTADENVRVKVGVYSSLDQGSGVLGTDRGTIFLNVGGTALVLYTNDGTSVNISY